MTSAARHTVRHATDAAHTAIPRAINRVERPQFMVPASHPAYMLAFAK
jgi:hypothetical protein